MPSISSTVAFLATALLTLTSAAALPQAGPPCAVPPVIISNYNTIFTLKIYSPTYPQLTDQPVRLNPTFGSPFTRYFFTASPAGVGMGGTVLPYEGTLANYQLKHSFLPVPAKSNVVSSAAGLSNVFFETPAGGGNNYATFSIAYGCNAAGQIRLELSSQLGQWCVRPTSSAKTSFEVLLKQRGNTSAAAGKLAPNDFAKYVGVIC